MTFCLKNEAAQRNLKKILKCGCFSSARTSLLSLIQFDAIMVDAFDLFSSTVQSSQSSDRFLLQHDNDDAGVSEHVMTKAI